MNNWCFFVKLYILILKTKIDCRNACPMVGEKCCLEFVMYKIGIAEF
jgi:hypothetical protein